MTISLNLFDLDKAPEVIRITTGSVSTELVRSGTKEDPYWVGVPVNIEGQKCRFALRIDAKGNLIGSAAIRFITAGGWKRGGKWVKHDQVLETRAAFTRAFLRAAIEAEAHRTGASLLEYLQGESGMDVTAGDNTPLEEEIFALMGRKAYLLRLAKENNLRFEVDVVKHMEKYVAPTYARIVPGSWDDESDEVSDTSNLQSGQVRMLQLKGLKFEKAARNRATR